MYNDYQITDSQSARAMRQKFDEVKGLETQDLNEIYDKLSEQRTTLIEQNSSGKLNGAISLIDSSLSSIKEIINRNNSNNSDTYKSLNLANILNKTYTLINPDGAYGKIRSEEEMMAHSNQNQLPEAPSNTPSNNNQNNMTPSQPGINNPSAGDINDNIITPPTNTPTTITTRKRNSPLQGSLIDNLTKSLFLRRKRNKVVAEKYQNRFHNIITQSECPMERRIVNNQIDLLRLLLLFIALRPNCQYLPKIAKITSTQFEVLLQLLP